MENKTNGMVGMGKYQNGVMTFVDATGKGFAKKISTPVVRREPAVKFEVSTIKEEETLDVPSFMKNRINTPAEPKSNVVYLNNGYEGEQKKTFRNDIKNAKKALKALNNWLWDLK